MASSSRSQVIKSVGAAYALLTCNASSISVPWRPSLATVVVTRFVTQLSVKTSESATILDQSSELASLSAEVRRCTTTADVVVTQLDTQRRLMTAVGSFSVREA